jgi:acetyl-CoA acetyltransferase
MTRHTAMILGGARTPIGRYGGSLSHIRTDDLLGLALNAAVERVGVERGDIEEIAAGCVNPAHEGMGDVARWAALSAGFPVEVPAYTVNRFCASSLTTTIQLAHAVATGELALGVSAGVESMSRSGFALMKGEEPFSLAVRSWCWTPCGREPEGRPTPPCWPGTRTWR